jgi:universal stress protein E
MSELPEKIFVVVDPTSDRQIALERSIITAQLSGNKLPSLLHIFIAVDMDHVDSSADNPKLYRSNDWYDRQIVKPLEDSGISYSSEMCWSSDWYGSIVQAAKQYGAGRIVVPVQERASLRDRLFNESMWRLIRTSTCPVLMVKPESPTQRKVILAAVNFQSHRKDYQHLNDLIIERGQWLAKEYDADLHIVNGYYRSLNYPDRSELASRTSVPSAHIHVQNGQPEDVIASVAAEINADIVVLGLRIRVGRWRGNTSEKTIDRVNSDLLAIN